MARGIHSRWVRGTNAERLALDTSNVAVPLHFYEIDTGDIYYWDGVAWQAAGGGGVGAHEPTHRPGGTDALTQVPDHDHTGDAGDGAQISHDTALTGISIDDHHARDHEVSHRPGGADALTQVPDHDHTGDAGDGAKIDHGLALDGLGDDDHPQYAAIVQDESISGDWNFGSGEIGLPAGTSFPGAPGKGDVYYRTDLNTIYQYDGSGWVQLQDMRQGNLMFDDADGLLLLDFQRWVGEGSEADRANYIVGSRLERARIGAAADDYDDRGSLHFEAGRWRNESALVIEEEGSNYCINPLMYDGDSSGLADDYVTWNNVADAIIWSVVDHPDKLRKGWAQRIQYTAIAGDVGTSLQLRHTSPAASFAPDDDCTVSCEIWGPHSGITIRLTIRWENAANADLGTTTLLITSDVVSNIHRFDFTDLTAPADTDHVRFDIRIGSFIDGDIIDIHVAALNIEKTNYPTTLIHGGLGDGYYWTGVPHASTSGRTKSYILLDDYVGLISNNDTLSFRLVVQAPYDYDAEWPGGNWSQHLMDARDSGDTGNTYLDIRFNKVDNRFSVTLGANTTVLLALYPFSAGDWLDILVTLDFANDLYYMYINGEEVDSATDAEASQTLDSWNLGCLYNENDQAGWAFAEFAVLNRILEAWEVGNLYASQRPLTAFFTFHRSFTHPGTCAGQWTITYGASTASFSESYTEEDVGNRLTFAGIWARSRVFFEVVAECDVDAYARLVYYDVATAAWRAVPDSEVAFSLPRNRIRTDTPLCLPLSELEYGVEQKTAYYESDVKIYRATILVMPGGEDNL